MNNYKLQAPYEPNGDQPEAIKKLVRGVNRGKEFQTLLGATGTGKTYYCECNSTNRKTCTCVSP